MDNGYTLFMIRDMMRMSFLCHTKEDFCMWLEATYLEPARSPLTPYNLRVPPFESCEDAMDFARRYVEEHPEEWEAMQRRMAPQQNGAVVAACSE